MTGNMKKAHHAVISILFAFSSWPLDTCAIDMLSGCAFWFFVQNIRRCYIEIM